jgi:uncharacterized protein (TIGR02145 family)
MKSISLFVFILLGVVFTSTNAQNLPAYLPANGLVAWYPFNGNANDESGNGNDGVVNGATLTSDRNGNSNSAFSFNGVNDYITVLNSYSLNSTSITISGWVKLNNIGSDVQGLVSRWNQTNTPCANFSTSIDLISSFTGACTQYQNTVLYSNVDVGVWFHFIYIHDENIGGRIYINANITNSNNIAGSICISTNNLIIGAQNLSTSDSYFRYLNGLIDDIAIYNRALTQEEITALYTGTPVNNNNGGNNTANAVPPGIPYQAVVRNANGQVAANTVATTKFTLHQNTTNGAVEYQETHALTTNAQGLVSAVIGQGTAVQGTFAGINWSNTTKFLQVEVDLGNGYVDLGTQQLMSVPFALYAANGPQGAQGPAGPQGPAGADGAAGATGATGPQGPAANLTVSQTGDTLYTGNGNFILIPGISAANYPTMGNGVYTQGNGVTDIDGNTYSSIIINGQEWMQQNLAVTKYSNGDLISTGLSDVAWSSASSGAFAIFNNDAANNNLYGKLYNWYAVSDGRGLCPTGWHVPSDDEWSYLIDYLDTFANGGSIVNLAGGRMKATTGWSSPNTGASNESGFTALPGGYRNGNGTYFTIGASGDWWSSTESNTENAWYRYLNYDRSSVTRSHYTKQSGGSVRCVRD